MELWIIIGIVAAIYIIGWLFEFDLHFITVCLASIGIAAFLVFLFDEVVAYGQEADYCFPETEDDEYNGENCLPVFEDDIGWMECSTDPDCDLDEYFASSTTTVTTTTTVPVVLPEVPEAEPAVPVTGIPKFTG